MVYISGVVEILLGMGLFWPDTRRLAGYGLAALLVAVFPANIYMAIANIHPPGVVISPWILWARLPLQSVLIWWVLWVSKRP